MLAYVGDGNNVARSLAILGTLAGVEVRSPRPPATSSPRRHGAQLTDDPAEAAAGADALYTDVWVLDGRRRGRRPRRGARRSRPTGSTTRCSTARAPDAIALHCLPAHPGEEITEEVLYGDAPAHLGPGREPPPRAEGAAGAARFAPERSSRSAPTMPQPRQTSRKKTTRARARAAAREQER